MKILIADDNRINRIVLENYIHNIPNLECLTAENGEEAIQQWETHGPDILITDLEMPNRDGFSVITEIRARETDSYTYIIVLTGHDDEESLSRSFEAGADDFLAKPFDNRELVYRIHAGERIISLFQKQFVVYALAHLTEVRDVDSGKHIKRISAYSKVIANALKENSKYAYMINRRFIEQLEIASALHDIGKIGIDDAILRKPDKLDDNEWAIMKTHTIIGHQTIENISTNYPKAQFLKMSAEVARWHHEWYNGTGYPDGLRGDEIPLSARIVALADVFDALINVRPYKREYTFEEASEIIINDSGTHFDPDIVDVFRRNESIFRQIALSNTNEQNIRHNPVNLRRST